MVGNQALHVHHIDLDATCDAEENLVTLCESCHARAHTGMRRGDRAEWIRRMLRASGQERSLSTAARRLAPSLISSTPELEKLSRMEP
ncbi:MAG: HNH endonuclease signature motif containing protein [Methanomicrobiaceae archaeon]|nr:HNH endonuclease signature motif containing protein [Methanomicrobiaceae archaeon]